MWTSVLLCVLAVSASQAAGQRKDDSTQVFYATLVTDECIIERIPNILNRFQSQNSHLAVEDLRVTGMCQSVPDGTECTCGSNYTWNEVCQTDLTVNGSFISTNLSIIFDENPSALTEGLSVTMKTEFSTLRGFESLWIGRYWYWLVDVRGPSCDLRQTGIERIVIDFNMTFVNKVNTQDLERLTNKVAKDLNVKIVLETRGIVDVVMPANLTCYGEHRTLLCTFPGELGTPAWHLKKRQEEHSITNGSESVVMPTTGGSKLILSKISKLWAASAVLDVSLQPQITITASQVFPVCKDKSQVIVTVRCENNQSSEQSPEPYKVEWESRDIKSIQKETNLSSDAYGAQALIQCDSMLKPQLTCSFQNRCGEKRNATIAINVITGDDVFCAAEDGWEITKADFTAVLPCRNAHGQRHRKCNNGPTGAWWGQVVSACVNRDVDSVLQSAKTVGIGLGSTEKNVADVFSRLKSITANTQTINSSANMNASVDVLASLRGNLSRIGDSAVDDLLDSSSSLLEESLKEAWLAEISSDNMSLAEKYLSSVERLIDMTNINGSHTKPNVQVEACTSTPLSQCTNTVFSNSVSLLGSDASSVKTIGFKNLQGFFPHKNSSKELNSIVVSTTTEKHLEEVQVQIKFDLQKRRLKDVMLECVFWDSRSKDWSSEGCDWGGPSDETRCTCRHLSSYAVLMSKTPLKVALLDEITVAGLSVSIISLIISLGIEVTIWGAVVKTEVSYLRHIAHVNIGLCLLVADCCFLASSSNFPLLCKVFAVVKHFCYLSMFFWMLCLSSVLLHQAVFVFHKVSKSQYLRYSLVLGYVCPLLIVAVTFLINDGGADGKYFSKDTCWLVYISWMDGSIHTFIIPVGVIVFINVFTMLVTIMKHLDHPKNIKQCYEKEKTAAKNAMRSVILLTPIFGVTWIFGFAVLLLDLTDGVVVELANYSFTVLNAFQGLSILLTTCLGDKLVVEALLNRIKKKDPASIKDGSVKKK
ncbi:adhesion G-protein coupled receptor F3 [Aulostomus maculatus]